MHQHPHNMIAYFSFLINMEPVRSRQGVIFEGGYLRSPWAPCEAEVREVDGLPFLRASKNNRRFAEAMGLDLNMRSPWEGNHFIDFLLQQRNKIVESHMTEKHAEEEDPLSGASPALPTKRSRKEMMAGVPDIITIDLPQFAEHLEGYSLKVLTCPSKRDVIEFELTPENIDYLAEAVHAEHSWTLTQVKEKVARKGPLFPEFPAVLVKERNDSTVLYCKYIGADGKAHQHCATVKQMDNEWLRAELKETKAREVQTFYNMNNVLPCPSPSPVRISAEPID